MAQLRRLQIEIGARHDPQTHVVLANQRLQDFARVPQAGYFVLDFMPDSLQSNAFNTAFLLSAKGDRIPVENLDIRVTTSAADTLTIYTESYSLNSQL